MRSEGIRRLSVLLGTLGILGWIILVLVGSEGLAHAKDIPVRGWLLIIAGIPTCFFVPVGLVRGIAWVVEGFKCDKNGT